MDRFAALRNLPRRGFGTALPPAAAVDVKPPPPPPPPPATKQKKPKPNESCHCGSHKKYKKCCMQKDSSATVSSPIAQIQDMMRKDKTFAANMRKMSEMLVPSAAVGK
jgi:hypothetical protein